MEIKTRAIHHLIRHKVNKMDSPNLYGWTLTLVDYTWWLDGIYAKAIGGVAMIVNGPEPIKVEGCTTFEQLAQAINEAQANEEQIFSSIIEWEN